MPVRCISVFTGWHLFTGHTAHGPIARQHIVEFMERAKGKRTLVETFSFCPAEATEAEEAGIDTMKVRIDPRPPEPAIVVRETRRRGAESAIPPRSPAKTGGAGTTRLIRSVIRQIRYLVGGSKRSHHPDWMTGFADMEASSDSTWKIIIATCIK